MKGQITKVIAGFYDIYSNNLYYRVRGSGKLRHLGIPPVVGDFVEFEKNKAILKIYSRKNFLIRPKVANIDQVVIVISTIKPNYNSYLLNKILSTIEFNNIKPILVITKVDLMEPNFYEEYKKMNYDIFLINNNNKNSLEKLKKIFENKLSVFTGQTGVGKSTTISSLTNVELKSQEISKALGRGKHTTRVVEIITWNKGWLIDSPGFSSFENNLTKIELSKSFFVFKKYMHNCKFTNCSHIKENICGIKKAIHENKISMSRYNDYIRLYKEAANE